MANEETVTFIGQSGNGYKFTVYPLQRAFLAVGVVYVIARRYLDAGTWRFRPVYIGITGDLSTRFDDHHKSACFTKNGANCICIHREDTEAVRFTKETDLVRHWNPCCNG